MQKNASLNKLICLTTAVSFSFAAIFPYAAKANNLAPLSFRKMYSLAQNGDVEALRASVRRGMNIDVVTPDGETGLCIAARKHDAYTYNSFRAAGANPHHPCVQNIDDYEEFVNSSRAVPVTAAPREALGRVGGESYSISPRTWWILGGLAVIGGVAAIVASHGGGGGGGGDGDDGKEHTETYDSLGTNAATNGTTYKKTSDAATLKSTLVVTNKKITKDQVKSINLISDVMTTTDYLYRGLLARKGGTYTNSPAGIIELGTAAAGMVSINQSKVVNNGYIKADSANATLAMIASKSSSAVNNASGIIKRTSSLGIDLNFAGDDVTRTVVGMYADTNSSLINNGDIRGTATKVYIEPEESSDTSEDEESDDTLYWINNISTSADETVVPTTAIKGNIIGMEAMILNVGSDVQDDKITVTNSALGEINLSAGDSGTTSTTVNLTSIAMGSFLDEGFLNGSKNITRAEKVTLTNSGKINIGYTGIYQAGDTTPLRKGTGGIVGMRAEANTTAINTDTGVITLTLTDYGSQGGSATTSTTDTGAGMQSVHGSSLMNNGTIQIITNASNKVINYGMLAVEGSGTVSGLYTSTKQILNNYGTIYIEASNSYGMASYNGGTLNNNANSNIILGKDMSNYGSVIDADTLYTNNVGMYGSGDSTVVKMNNYGTIDVYSYKSIAMKNNFSGGVEICNDGVIHIHSSAIDSKVFAGFYSVLKNNGTINYDVSEAGVPSLPGSASDPFVNLSVDESKLKSVMTTKSAAESSSSTTEFIYNNEGKYINLNGSSFTSVMSVETLRGAAENNGTIFLNPNKFDSEGNAIGMYLDSSTISSAYIENKGTIDTNFYMSVAMASLSQQNAAMINSGLIITRKDYSIGMGALSSSKGSSATYTLMKNYKNITVKGSYSAAMYATGNTNIKNEETAEVIVGSDSNFVSNSYGLYSKSSDSLVDNLGKITVYSGGSGAAIYASGENVKITNNKIIEGSMSIGISSEGDGANIVNTSQGTIDGALSYGIYASGESASISNEGSIGSSSSKPTNGIYASQSGAYISNSGTIYASNNGIYAYAAGTSEEDRTTIYNSGTINSNTYGIYVTIDSYQTYLTVSNSGTINAPIGIYFQHNYEKPEKLPDDWEININLTTGGASYQESYIEKESSSTSAATTSILRNISFVNTGMVNVGSDLDFDDDNILYAVGQNGTYQAPSLTGTVLAAASLVENGFDTVYTNTDSLIGQDNGVNVVSESYMFTADKVVNESGNEDIVLTKKPFANITSNSSLAAFMENNYAQQNNETLFGSLKKLSTQTGFNAALNKKFGLNFVPNLAKQNLDNERTVQSEINADLLEDAGLEQRHLSKILTYRNKVRTKGNVSGYKDNIIAAYNINDIVMQNNLRVGLGVSAIRADSDYTDGSNRYNNILEIFVPVSTQYGKTSALFKPKAGFGRGHYRRTADNGKNKAQTKEYYYGVDAAAKHSIDLDYIQIEPNAGVSVTGMYLKGDNESNNGLRLKSKNIVSAVSSIGADIKKQFKLNDKHFVTFVAGGKYNHEFGNKYTQKASMKDMDGFYEIESNRLNRDFGLLQAKLKYNYEQFMLEASANKPIESKHKAYYMFDLGYSF